MKNLDIHLNPKNYTSKQRAMALHEMLSKMLFKKSYLDSYYDELVSEYENDLQMEAFMLGLAIASDTITIAKCREFLTAAQFTLPHELSAFAGEVRDASLIEETSSNDRFFNWLEDENRKDNF